MTASGPPRRPMDGTGAALCEAAERSFWDAAFRFSAILPDFQGRMSRQAVQSRAYRDAHPAAAHKAYGTHARQFVRSHLRSVEAKDACIFVHGGYWRALSVDDHDFVGDLLGPTVDFHNVEYRLQPEVGFAAQIEDVARGVQAALEICAQRCIHPVRVVGHSAGAHLVLGAMQRLASMSAIGELCLISGIYDLAPVSRSFLVDEITISAEDIALFSPLRGNDFAPLRHRVVVGRGETAEYLRQAFELTRLLQAHGRTVACSVVDGADHLQTVGAFFAS